MPARSMADAADFNPQLTSCIPMRCLAQVLKLQKAKEKASK